MVVLMIILTIVVFLAVDLLSRAALKRYQENQSRKEREAALETGLKIVYSDEAPSLKHVTVDHPKATILAVDDEPVVLDSFRRILVMAGYAVDTVETGKEAIGLVRKNDYDFVFTDLKMPEMDGIDIVKAVKHLCPDVDVIMITGYATVESAVEVMKHGAMDYVQKPFTADELIAFVNKSLIRREDRRERQTRPRVHLVTASSGASAAPHAFNVPAGVFIAPTHTWASLTTNGMLMIGVDDFALKLIGPVEDIELPQPGQHVEKGAPLFSIKPAGHALAFPAPVSGKILNVNTRLHDTPGFMNRKPFELGWVCSMEPTNLAADLQDLHLGADAVDWYREEVGKYFETLRALQERGEEGAAASNEAVPAQEPWEAFSRAFLHT